MPSQTQPLFEQIDTWLVGLQQTKAASAPKPGTKANKPGQVKAAGPSGMGKTTHPSEKIDNNTHETPYGERYSENERDVKADVPANVEEAPEGMNADEDKVMPNIGLHQSATGEDSSIETEKCKGDKDDGTTSHPADAEDIGEKYSSYTRPQLLKAAEDKANKLLADIANGFYTTPTAAPAQPTNKQASTQPASTPPAAAAAAGYQTAAAAAEPQLTEADLQKMAATFIEQTIRDADLDADLVGSYFTSWRQKRAAGEELPPPEEGGGGGEVPPPGMPPMAGGMPPEAGPPGAGAEGPPPGAGAEGPPPDMAGGGGGGDPLAALGAAAQDASPGQGDKEQALHDLIMALQELGIDESQLAAMAQEQGPEGAPEKAAALAKAATAYKRAGKFEFSGPPKTAREKRSRALIKDYVRELAGLK